MPRKKAPNTVLQKKIFSYFCFSSASCFSISRDGNFVFLMMGAATGWTSEAGHGLFSWERWGDPGEASHIYKKYPHLDQVIS